MYKATLVNLVDPVIETPKAESDPTICACMKVKASTIQMAMEVGNAATLEEINDLTQAGTGCEPAPAGSNAFSLDFSPMRTLLAMSGLRRGFQVVSVRLA